MTFEQNLSRRPLECPRSDRLADQTEVGGMRGQIPDWPAMSIVSHHQLVQGMALTGVKRADIHVGSRPKNAGHSIAVAERRVALDGGR